MKIIKSKEFANGIVYALETWDGYPIETTDTFLPYYTKNAIGKKQNKLKDYTLGNRSERWMIGVSVMSGCPVHCKFCATGQLKKWRPLTADEIINQVFFVIGNNMNQNPKKSKEFKINYTRMGEPFLNIDNVKKAITEISNVLPATHHYISTIGIKDADYSWINRKITLQVSLHTTDKKRRNWLIPYTNKETIEKLGKIHTESYNKTTLNLTLVDKIDFDINKLKKYFNKGNFFIKLSPINSNPISDVNNMGHGFIEGLNLI